MNSLRYALRVLSRRQGFVLASVLTLALAIGVNTAIFSVVNGVLLRPLPYKNPGKIVLIWQADSKRGIDHFSVSLPYFQGWRENNHTLGQISAFAGITLDLTGKSGPERVSGTLISANFFSLLGVQPALGRTFSVEEDGQNHTSIAVISHELWQRRFGSKTDIVGQALTTDTASYTIIGVMPRFQFLNPADVWIPLGRNAESLHIPGNYPAKLLVNVTPLNVVARLKEGVTLGQAQDDITAVTRGMQTEFGSRWQSRVVALEEELVGTKTRRILLVLQAAVGLVFLIACANIVNLQLTHLTSRQKEMATRVALGATRKAVFSQLLTECGIIAFTGGVLGLLVAFTALRLSLASLPTEMGGPQHVEVNGRVLLFTLGLSLLSIPLFGAVPVLRVFHSNLVDSLREGLSNTSSGGRQRRLQSLFVVSEVALASVLLIGSLLTVKSLYRLSAIDLGIDPQHVLTMGVNLSPARYRGPEKQSAFFKELYDQIQTIPDVHKVGATSFLPLTGLSWQWTVSVEGNEGALIHTYPANYRVVDRDYFSAMGVPLLQGREFSAEDSISAPNVVIVNEEMAKQLWPNQSPIGKRMRMGDRTATVPWLSVVGVVANVKEVDLTDQPKPVFYVPYQQNAQASMVLVIKTIGNPANVLEPVRQHILALDANQPVHDIRTMEEVLSNSTASSRFNMLLLTAFAGLATLLALVGIYGVIGYFVNQRAHEIAIRLALGARRPQITIMMLRQTVALIVMGICSGLLLATGVARLLANLLYEVKASDPAVFFVVALLLFAVACLAGFLPLRRTSRIDPVVSLRYE